MDHIKVQGHSGYVRQRYSGAVLNTNTEQIIAAKEKKAALKKQKEEIETLKNDASDIKSMLTKIVEKIDGNNIR